MLPEFLRQEKSTRRFLLGVIKATYHLIESEFGEARAKGAKISFSRKMYFTLGRCWPDETRIAFNLAWVLLNRRDLDSVWGLIVHEVAHLRDPAHGEGFKLFCAKFGVPEVPSQAKTLPPVAWLLCSTCGDNQGVIFSSRLAKEEVMKRFSGKMCRSCGSEVEYRELSDKSFKRVQERVKKLRIYDTSTWKHLRGITC